MRAMAPWVDAVVRSAIVCLIGLLVAGCPIRRPPVPAGYLDHRARLETLVADSAADRLDGRARMQARLAERLPDLASHSNVDSLVEALRSDPDLRPLAEVASRAVRTVFQGADTPGRISDAYRTLDGQRLAADGILIGLGRSLRRVRRSPDPD